MAKNTKTEGKSSNKNLFIIIGAVILVLVIGGYIVNGIIARMMGEKMVEGLIKAGTGGKVDVDVKEGGFKISDKEGSMETGSSAKWPSDMPGSIPKIQTGKITASLKTNSDGQKGWTVIISEIESDIASKYKADLLSSGWEEKSNLDIGVSISEMEKGDLKLNLTYDPSSKGISIIVTQNSN